MLKGRFPLNPGSIMDDKLVGLGTAYEASLRLEFSDIQMRTVGASPHIDDLFLSA